MIGHAVEWGRRATYGNLPGGTVPKQQFANREVDLVTEAPPTDAHRGAAAEAVRLPSAPEPTGGPRTYIGFISYSHADRGAAKWLHKALEGYRIPKRLVGLPSPLGVVPERLAPIFRDQDELRSSGSLGQALEEALASSSALIVVCSPHAAKSRWVDEEILTFKRMHGDGRIFPVIFAGEPNASFTHSIADPASECFPPALRLCFSCDGTVAEEPAEPVAADLRRNSDGKRFGLLKVVAGLTGLRLDDLVQRDAARRQRRLIILAFTLLLGMAAAISLALYANAQRLEANLQRQSAIEQRQTAEASLDFLVETFKLANPEVENPRRITVVSLLDRSSERVRASPERVTDVQARVLRTLGEVYLKLGLMPEAERDLMQALRIAKPYTEDRIDPLLRLAALRIQQGDYQGASRLIRQAQLEIREGPSHGLAPDVLRSLEARTIALRGGLEYSQARPRAAVRLLAHASKLFDDRQERNLVAKAQALNSMGMILVSLGDNERAENALREATALLMRRYGPDHLETARAIHNSAYAAMAGGRLGEAEARAGQAAAIYARVLDATHPSRADIAILQGRIAEASGALQQAVRFFDEAIAIYIAAFGPDDLRVAEARILSAELKASQQQHDRALTLLNEAKRTFDREYGPLHIDQADLAATRAAVVSAMGQERAGALNCAAALKIFDQLPPDEQEATAAIKACANRAKRREG